MATMTGPQLKEKIRFEQELEFVQCLANPEYLNCKLGANEKGFVFWLKQATNSHQHNIDLAQRLYFEDERFIGYLRYLTYWKDPKYARYIL